MVSWPALGSQQSVPSQQTLPFYLWLCAVPTSPVGVAVCTFRKKIKVWLIPNLSLPFGRSHPFQNFVKVTLTKNPKKRPAAERLLEVFHVKGAPHLCLKARSSALCEDTNNEVISFHILLLAPVCTKWWTRPTADQRTVATGIQWDSTVCGPHRGWRRGENFAKHRAFASLQISVFLVLGRVGRG